MSLDRGDFDYVCTLLRTQSGTVLEPGKEYLVQSRLGPVAKQAGCESLSELIGQLRGRPVNDLHTKVVEALITNETQFFRDGHPFDAIRSAIIPRLISRRAESRELNLWCAAASTGQEPYSLAMLLAESFPMLANWDVSCIASDMSAEVLERARSGTFGPLEVKRGLPSSLLSKYFQPQGSGWQISEQIRRQVEFRQINLVLAWPSLPAMDLILLRNVLIYLDVATKKVILEKVRQQLKPDGYLFLGTAETTLNLDPAFEQVHVDKTVCYRLRS